MSVYGVETVNAGGVSLIDATARINRIAYANEVSAGVSGSADLSAVINGLNTVEMSWVINSSAVNCFPHEISRSGNTVSWVDPSAGTNIDSLIIVFITT